MDNLELILELWAIFAYFMLALLVILAIAAFVSDKIIEPLIKRKRINDSLNSCWLKDLISVNERKNK